MILEARQVTLAFHNRPVLDEVSLHLEKGQLLALLGSSGSGKSSLLRVLNGLILPHSGQVLFQGVRVEKEMWPLLRRQIGFVLQDGGLFPHLSVGQNMALGAANFGWDSPQIQQRQQQLLELLRLPSDCLKRFPRQLSGGQRQRVSIARALFLEPPLLLLDEALGALDPVIRHELQDELKILFRQSGCAAILVTHDLSEAAHFADEIALLHQGQISQRGDFHYLAQNCNGTFQEFLEAHRSLPCSA